MPVPKKVKIFNLHLSGQIQESINYFNREIAISFINS